MLEDCNIQIVIYPAVPMYCNVLPQNISIVFTALSLLYEFY